jgi:hypothetical protein
MIPAHHHTKNACEEAQIDSVTIVVGQRPRSPALAGVAELWHVPRGGPHTLQNQ